MGGNAERRATAPPKKAQSRASLSPQLDTLLPTAQIPSLPVAWDSLPIEPKLSNGHSHTTVTLQLLGAPSRTPASQKIALATEVLSTFWALHGSRNRRSYPRQANS
jgi:hypothetical protein